MAFSERLKDLRKENAVQQETLAELLKVSARAVRFYEAGRREPAFSSLITIADFFGVSTDYLLGRSDDPRRNEFGAKSHSLASMEGK